MSEKGKDPIVQTIPELTLEEDRLCSIVMSVTGTIEEMSDQLANVGVYDAYSCVHVAYTKLAVDGDIESLKRAIFLQWYSQSEPACFTGLGRIKEKEELYVLKLLNDLAVTDGFDEEMRWMLLHYYAITDFYFNSERNIWHRSTRSLNHWLRNNKLYDTFPDEQVKRPSLAGPGQMSEYWYRPNHIPM